MLKQRVVTALILAAGVLSALFFLPPAWFALFAAGFLMIAGWEWGNLAAASRPVALIFYGALALIMGWLFIESGLSQNSLQAEKVKVVFLAGSVWWAIALLWVQGYPSSALLWGSTPVRLVMGLLVLVPAWLALSWLVAQQSGVWLVIVVILTVACADIGAYFAGKAFGRHKLAPEVSPGKTVEGFIGGITLVLVVMAVVLYFTPSQRHLWWQWLVLEFVTVLASVLGDLLESMVKRHRGVKDSGKILPGHGGVLDRIDSLTAALPVFALVHLLLIQPLL